MRKTPSASGSYFTLRCLEKTENPALKNETNDDMNVEFMHQRRARCEMRAAF